MCLSFLFDVLFDVLFDIVVGRRLEAHCFFLFHLQLAAERNLSTMYSQHVVLDVLSSWLVSIMPIRSAAEKVLKECSRQYSPWSLPSLIS